MRIERNQTAGGLPVAQMVKNLQETRVRSLGWEDPLEKRMAIHSSIRDWRIPSTEKPGGLQFMGSQRVGHDWVIHTHTHTHTHTHRHTHTQVEGFWDLVTIKPIEYVMEKKICLWLLSPCTQKNLEGKSEVCERYGVAFAMEWQQFFSCLPTTFNNGFGIPFLYRTIQSY